MGRTIPMPVEADFNRARSLIKEGGEVEVISIAQLIAENRWLSNIVHQGVHTADELQRATDVAFDKGHRAGWDDGFFEGQQQAKEFG
jgi:hypothetical protein